MLDLGTAGGHDNQTSHSLSLRRLPPYLLPPFGSATETSGHERAGRQAVAPPRLWHLLGFGTSEAALVAAHYCVYTTDDLYH